MSTVLNPDVRARLDAHLDAVEKALVDTQCSRERRRGIVDDLEAQIVEMLERRSSAPTAADLDAVLATLDPPAAYSEAAATPRQQPAPATPAARSGPPLGESPFGPKGPFGEASRLGPSRPRLSGLAVAGLLCILGSMLFSALTLGLLYLGAAHAARRVTFASPSAPPQTITINPTPMPQNPTFAGQSVAVEDPQPQIFAAPAMPLMERKATWIPFGSAACVGVLPFLLALLGTLLGWMALGRIRASGGKLYGRGLALFDGLFYPALFGLLLLLIFPLPMFLLILVAGGIVGIILLIRFLPARA